MKTALLSKSIRLTGLSVALMAGLTAATMSNLLAASGTSATEQPASPFGLINIPAFMALLRRKKPIGGLLFYFFWSIFAGVAITAIFLAIGIKNYLPSTWNDQYRLYSLFLASTLPGIAAQICLFIAAIAVLRTRNWEWVLRIRSILAADILVTLVGLLIDASFFPENLLLGAYSLIFPVIFLPYTYRSKRVRRVFLSKDWQEY
jgi:hypothetical protein